MSVWLGLFAFHLTACMSFTLVGHLSVTVLMSRSHIKPTPKDISSNRPEDYFILYSVLYFHSAESLQGRQSVFKAGCVVGPGLKTWVSWAHEIQQTESHSTGPRVSS